MSHRARLEVRLIRVLASFAVVAVVGILAILPYRLYERDIRHAEVEAHRLSSLVHVAIGSLLARGEDPTDLVNRFQSIADFEIRLRQLAAGEAHPSAKSHRASSHLAGTDLDYVAPPLRDREGGEWLAEMHFDLTPMKRDSVRIIIDLVIAVALGSLVFSLGMFFFLRRTLLQPLRVVRDELERFESAPGPVGLPEFHSQEMVELAQAIERLCTERLAGAKV